jgi:hypothetical protein
MNEIQRVEQYQPEVIDYIPSVSVTLEQAAHNLNKLTTIMRKVMREKVDFDKIPGTPKPTLLKPGAERLLQFFGLGHKVQCIEKITDWDAGFFYFCYKVTIVKTYPQLEAEIVVAECEGSANSKEKRYRNQDVYSLVNTLQKMAIKRALVGATLQATGTSGFFTQDLDDFEDTPTPEAPRRESNGSERNRSQGLMKNPDGPATQAQINACYSIGNKKGLDRDQVKQIASQVLEVSVESLKDLTKDQASTLITFLQNSSNDGLQKLVHSGSTGGNEDVERASA